MRKKQKNTSINNKGITLIALVITIVVLIILATVSINLLLGNNGLIRKTSQAKEETNIATILEQLKLKISEIYIEKEGRATLQDVIDYFNTDPQYEYIVSLTQIATISGDIPSLEDVTNATEIFVIYKEYQFKIDSKLNVTAIGFYTETPQVRETDIGVKHIENEEWIAEKPTDNWFASKDYYDVKWQGEGTQETPYLITSENELAGLSYRVANGETFSGKYFELTKDLSMGKHIWVPIGGIDTAQPTNNNNYYKSKYAYCFSGNFDGKGNSISGLYFNCSERDYGVNFGLFGVIKYQSNYNILISNIKIEDSYLSHSNVYTEFYGGAIAARIDGDSTTKIRSKVQIINCDSRAIIEGRDKSNRYPHLAGICGMGSYLDITRCNNYGSIIGSGYIGGICGNSNTSNTDDVTYVSNCQNFGILTGNISNSSYIGGIIGSNVSCYNCVNYADITVTVSSNNGQKYSIGGIVGSLGDKRYTINCFNIGKIDVTGGNNSVYVGGIAGDYVNKLEVTNCYNNAEIKATNGYKGAIVGLVSSGRYPTNSYYKKNAEINSSINALGLWDKGSNNYSKENTTVGYYSSTTSIDFNYSNDGSASDGYSGDLTTKLNKWVNDNNSQGIYSSWIFDTEKGYPVFDEN